MNQSSESPAKPQSFWKALLEKLDKKLKEKSSQKPCCSTQEKNPDKPSCCG